jgi:hypothetical protein
MHSRAAARPGAVRAWVLNRMRRVRHLRVATLAALTAAVLIVPGCGSGSSSPVGADRPAPPASEFPGTSGRTLAQVLSRANGATDLLISPQAIVFHRGENRYPFGVFTMNHDVVTGAKVALYFAKTPPKAPPTPQPTKGKAPPKVPNAGLQGNAIGPFPAREESITTKPRFESSTTADDAHAVTTVYVTDVNLPSNGQWRAGAIIDEDGKLTATTVAPLNVGKVTGVPRAGERPPRIHTPTQAEVGGDLSKLTTRVPPEEGMNKVDFADALGRKPIVLLFATPQFCQSRVCGPVVDVAEQVRRDYGGDAEFIHMEIYNDNHPGQGVRPQVRAFHLPDEPWLFVIDRRGVIRSAIEGPFNVTELSNAVRAATRR